MRRTAAVGATLLAAALGFWTAAVGRAAGLPAATPEQVGMRGERLKPIDDAVADALKDRRMPGCVVMICRQGKAVFLKAYGDRRVAPTKEPMTTDTVFDMASLTKPIATATSVMLLAERGKLNLNDPVAKIIPEFAQNGKEKITVLDLLTHQGGLIADNALADYADGPEKARERLLAIKPVAAPGERFIYSDVGFMVLGEVVRCAAGKNLREFCRENTFDPLGMKETGFLPGEALRQRAAPTERRGQGWMQGEVHDPRAYQLGGVAGHAGLFSTAADLAVFAQMMLDGGTCHSERTGTGTSPDADSRHRAHGGEEPVPVLSGDVRILKPETIAEMTSPHAVPKGSRGLGWDMKSSLSSNRSPAYSPRAFGHGGFTGTSLWIDPPRQLVVIFLSNRLHPDGKGNVNSLAARIGTLAVEAIGDAPGDCPNFRPSENGTVPFGAEAARVLPGIDVLERDRFAALKGRRVGLITNHTGVNRAGVSTAKLLRDAPNVTLVALFSPEHGIEGKLDVEGIADQRDPVLGVPIYSLYGKNRKPTAEHLKDIDTLVFDIQDIGARFYTYVSTMGYAMQAAVGHKLRFVVLDRPNPIGGRDVAGPLLDAGRESFVAFHRLPVRHGMTVGELARLFKDELRLELDLHAVRVEGWRREMYFDETGLKWINPSPNMRSLTEAILYPGVGLLETTNLSVGRGTATPFEVFGAPWLDGPRLAKALNDAAIPGVRFTATTFTPESSKFQGQRCQGINTAITDRKALEPVRMGLEIARQLRRLHGDQWDAKGYDRLLGNKRVHDAVLAGKTVAEIEALYGDELQDFQRKRAKYLLY
jgi:uncharacterized protein YbbC (DUF1343 family)/CubicO group peptidase (beta-lactamase class C family)